MRSFLAAILCWVSLVASAAGGTLLGHTLVQIPGGDNQGYRVLVQPDGKFIVVGYGRYGTVQFTLTRFNANGTIDASFDGGGTRFEYMAQADAEPWGATLMPDGKIFTVGVARNADRDRFAVARFFADGQLDVAFGGGGIMVTIGPDDAGAYSVVPQADGKVLIGGYSMSGGRKVFTVARLNTDSTTDTTYGAGGFYIAPAGAVDAVIHSMQMQPDGKLVVAGDGGATGGIQMRRLNANGSLDTTFGASGIANFANFNGAWDMELQPDGKILVVGSSLFPAVGPSPAHTDIAVLRANANGTLDTTFGRPGNLNGIGYLFAADPSMGTTSDTQGYGLVLLSDGKIVASGHTSTATTKQAAIGRLTASGDIDTPFGASGRRLTAYTGYDRGYGLARRADGGYIVAGGGQGPLAERSLDALTMGFSAAGTPDLFASGYHLLDVGSMTAIARANALQGDGKLVAVGQVTHEQALDCCRGVQAVAVRYLADGSLDTTFGSGGFRLFPRESDGTAVAIQPDGKIVVGGTVVTGGTRDLWFARLDASGNLDSTFGSGGMFSAAMGSQEHALTALALQPDGKIVGGGWVQNAGLSDALFVRLTAAGALDSTFNGGGFALSSMGSGSDELAAIAVQPDGKIVGAGWTVVSDTQESFAATRLNANGTRDTSFGNAGVALANFGTQNSHAFAMALQPDGRIVLGGRTFAGSTDDYALARLLANGALDSSFGNAGLRSTDFGNHNRIYALRIMPNGKIVGAGETGAELTLVQYLSNGTLDTGFGSGGHRAVVVNVGIDFATALAVGADGTLYASGSGSGLFSLSRFTGDTSAPASSVDLALTQSSNLNPAATGKDVIFTLVATNNGPTAASGVVVTDTLPAGATFVWASAGCSHSSGTVTCNVGNLANGASVQVRVVLRPGTAGSAANSATVAGAQFDGTTANNTATATITVNASPAAQQVVRYRLYSPVTQEHLFTTDKNEYDTLGAQSGNWTQEGQAGKVLDNPGSFNGVTAVPYYRLYNTVSRWHHWTTDANEYYTLIQGAPFNAEGVDGYLLPTSATGATQLYRLVYPDGRGLHHWTIDAVEYNQLITHYGWVGEGGSGYVIQ